jgi:ribosomal protein S12 methylthiotransferase
MTKSKKIHITMLGCSKNIYDSEILMGQLADNKAKFVSDPLEADVIVINTCGFIDKAKEESVEAILDAEQIKNKHPDKKLIVCGCLSQRYPEQLKKEIPSIDGLFGTEDYINIINFLNFSHKKSPEFLYEKRFQITPSHYAYLKIAEGCNHTCSFCAIPLMRGKHRSRSIKQIVTEAKLLASKGVRELILISQDTSFYGLDIYGEQKLVELLSQLSGISGIEWIRVHYLYPATVQKNMIDLIVSSEKIVPYLDMPIQHISNKMLKMMKRGNNARKIQEILEYARTKNPKTTLRTTVIVGHPGETKEDFEELKGFISQYKFDRLGVFQYSKENGTAAFGYKMNVPSTEKEERFNELMEIQKEISLKKNQSKMGSKVRVIIDEVNKDENYAVGRSNADSPEIDNEVIMNSLSRNINVGDFQDVRITDASEYELYGKIEDN